MCCVLYSRQTEHEFKEYKKFVEKEAKDKDLELKVLQDKVIFFQIGMTIIY